MQMWTESKVLERVETRSEALEGAGMRSKVHLQKIFYKIFRSFLSYSLIKFSSVKTFVLSVLQEKSIAELKIYLR